MKLLNLASNNSFWRGIDYHHENRIISWKELAENCYQGKVRVTYYFDNPEQSNDWWKMIRYYPKWIAEKYPDFKSKRISELYKNIEDPKQKKKIKEELLPLIIESRLYWGVFSMEK